MDFGPNVEQIRYQATLVVTGRIPASVRKELRDAVRRGHLGHLKKKGLLPEIFFHPDHLHGAIDRQKREAAYAIKCIGTAIVSGAERAEYDFNTFLTAPHKGKLL